MAPHTAQKPEDTRASIGDGTGGRQSDARRVDSRDWTGYPAGVRVEFRKLDPAVALPRRARDGDAGLDLRANASLKVAPGERAMVPTGLSVALPPGHAGLVLPRSGLASGQGLTLANSPGLIDPGYRGEITCAVVNLDPVEPVEIHVGDRIAQLLVVPYAEIEPVEVAELPSSDRGTGGFGSTGVQ